MNNSESKNERKYFIAFTRSYSAFCFFIKTICPIAVDLVLYHFMFWSNGDPNRRRTTTSFLCHFHERAVVDNILFFSSFLFHIIFWSWAFCALVFCIHLNKFPLIVNNLQNYVRIYYFLSSFSFRSLGRWLECFFARVTTKQEYVFFEMFVSMFLSSFFSPLLSSYWTQNDLLWRPHCIALIALIHLANVRVVCSFIFRRAFFITFKKS